MWLLTLTTANAADPSVVLHLDATIDGLRAADVSHLSDEQAANREGLLDALESYVRAGEFPHNHVDPSGRPAPSPVHGGMAYEPGRVPVFVDEHGTHCAVGYLLAVDGRDDLVEAAVDTDVEGYLTELVTPGLEAWADSNGFSVQELARIQPGYAFIHQSRESLLAIEQKLAEGMACEALWADPAVSKLYGRIASGQDGVDPSLPARIRACVLAEPWHPQALDMLEGVDDQRAYIGQHGERDPHDPEVCAALEAAVRHDKALLGPIDRWFAESLQECRAEAKAPHPSVLVDLGATKEHPYTMACPGLPEVDDHGWFPGRVALAAGVTCRLQIEGAKPLDVQAGSGVHCTWKGEKLRRCKVD